MARTRLPPDAPRPTVVAVLVLLAALLLLCGTALYLTQRPPSSAMALPAVWHLRGGAATAWPAADWLPSLLHPWAFGVASAALCTGPRARRGACLGWGGVNLLFEAGQHPAWAVPLAQALHGSGWPGAEPLARYLTAGRFDTADVLAVLAGTLAAWASVVLVERRLENPHA